MLVDEFSGTPVVDATPEQDDSIAQLARECGLHVDPSSHRKQAGAVLLVFVDAASKVVGFVSSRILLDEMEIFDLCVAPEARRRGIGRSLLQVLLRRAATVGVDQVFLEVRASNDAARALYFSLGFSPVMTRSRYYSDGEDATVFRCCLTPAP